MLLRRRCLGFRCKTSILIIVVGLSLVGLLISYQLLRELVRTNNNNSRLVYPALDNPRLDSDKLLARPAPHHVAFVHRDLSSKTMDIRGNFDAVSINDVREFYGRLNPTDWSKASPPDELAIELKHMLLDLDITSALSCKEIDGLRLGSAIAQSNRKYVERAQTEDTERKMYVVTSQSSDTETKIACLKKIPDDEHCSPMGNYKLFKQLLLLSLLKNPNIVELKGFCLRGDGISPELRKKGVLLVSDLGTPLSMSVASRLQWRKRLALAIEALDLVDYLDINGLGSLKLGQIASHDFVLFNGDEDLKLVDMDDVTLNERTCSSNEECDIAGVMYDIECVNNECHGLNSLSNLQKISTAVVDPLLRYGPSQHKSTIDNILENLRTLKMSKENAKSQIQAILDKANEQYKEQERNIANHNMQYDQNNNNYNNNNNDQQQQIINNNSDNQVDDNNYKYTRLEQSNYPGVHDYTCANSRVAWGCVITCRSVHEAQRKCNEDSQCKAFVIFSSQPERETLVTVVFKNSATSRAQPNPGTTLYVKKPRRGSVRRSQNVIQMSQNEEVGEDTNKNIPGKISHVKQENGDNVASLNRTRQHSAEVCLSRIFKAHEETRRSRERRLMAHFGLKGVREVEWQRSIQRQKANAFSNLIPAKDSSTNGGKFVTLLKSGDVSEVVNKAMFTAETGEEQYHIAQSIVYHLDRILGLYHTPPSIVGNIQASVVQKFQKNKTWKETFSGLLNNENGLKGIYSATIPHVMKQEKLVIKPLKKMVSAISKFSRQTKLQFEYVLLWWLTKLVKDPTDHVGYKGHLIHFNGDEAFSDLEIDLTGYFNHCQFPNIVYKTLNCLRCRNNQGAQLSSICSLGQEVVKRVKADKFRISEVSIHELIESDIVTSINEAASITVGQVEACIQLFGRENVLY